jgi:hypothetical protein
MVLIMVSVVLESFRQMSQYIKLFDGSVHLQEGQTDIRSIVQKNYAKFSLVRNIWACCHVRTFA